MKVNIEFDSSTATREDHQLLARLTEAINGMPAVAVPDTEAEKPVKASPAKKTAKAADPEPEDEVVEAEVVEDEDEVVEAESEDDAETLMEQAVQKATKLVSDGKAADVKAALEKAGARRVSELKDADSIRTFLDAL